MLYSNKMKKAMILVILICVYLLPDFANASDTGNQPLLDPYVLYFNDHDAWYYNIEEALNKSRENGFKYSPEAEQLIDHCNITLYEDESISICVQETLLDSIGGYINVLFSSDKYILRDRTCLDVYSPWYQAGETYDRPVCFIDLQPMICEAFSMWTQYEGLSADQKQLNIISWVEEDNGQFNKDSGGLLEINLHYFEDGKERVENLTLSFPVQVLDDIDECHMTETFVHEDYNFIVSDLSIKITPLRVEINPIWKITIDDSKETRRYHWELRDQNGKKIDSWSTRYGTGYDYLSSIPEPIYYVVYVEANRGCDPVVYQKELVRQGHVWWTGMEKY